MNNFEKDRQQLRKFKKGEIDFIPSGNQKLDKLRHQALKEIESNNHQKIIEKEF